MFMIMFVLNDRKQIDLILNEWNEAGIKGATLMESTGAYRHRMRIPGRYAYATTNVDEGNITLFAIVPDQAAVNNCLAATEKVVGDLNEPNTGVFTYWLLSNVKGIMKHQHIE